MHYKRLWKHGEDFDKSVYGEGDDRHIPERIERYSMPIPESGCIVWTSTVGSNGYPFLEHRGKIIYLHKYVYKMINGPIPKGLWILHKCDVKSCINPNHLYAGTPTQNAQDRERRGRGNPPKGSEHVFSKLNDDIVRDVRNSSESNYALGIKYGVARATIRNARNRKTWKHVP